MEKKILSLLRHHKYLPADASTLARLLKLRPRAEQGLGESLQKLEQSNKIARLRGNRFVLAREDGLLAGRIQFTVQGRAFLNPDLADHPEIAIAADRTGTALPDDLVLVRIDSSQGDRRKASASRTTLNGAVVEVLERRRTAFVGILKRQRGTFFVSPDDPRVPCDITVPALQKAGRTSRNGRVGDKVVVELHEWKSPRNKAEGAIAEFLGRPGSQGVDMLGVLRQYALSTDFSPEVLDEARGFGSQVTEKDLKGRTDCRKDPVITIDPDDAKDFDDAFSLRQESSGEWRLRVHIADVSHYVKPGSALDKEAHSRGNSTYLVDRVIPMLPEELSNDLCSLKPDVDRLTKCVEFLLAENGRVLETRFFSAVIHSRKRFSYQEALAVLEGHAQGPHSEMVRESGRLAQMIRRRRFANGSLDLDFSETKIRLDDRGRIDRIDQVENDPSHQLIEEFMLLTNEAVAKELQRLQRAGLHRVHEKPDADRLRDYREVVRSHNVQCGDLEKPVEVRKLLQRLGDLAIGSALKIGFLKSLNRARYAMDPLGHYGLAKKQYSHFTSPIRRYADLVTHRALFRKRTSKDALHDLQAVAEHISTTERNSSDAERDSKTIKLHAHLAAQIASGKRQRYPAVVTEIRSFGVFLDVPELGLSGLAPLSILADDYYEFDAERKSVRGRRHGRTIRLGDDVEVRIAKVDSDKRRVDFEILPVKKRKKSDPRPAKDATDEGAAKTKRAPRFARRRANGRKRRRAGRPAPANAK